MLRIYGQALDRLRVRKPCYRDENRTMPL